MDSADEWEEDEPGEELKSEDEEEEEEDGDALEEEEKDWLVPHGYLSDDEGAEKDEGEAGNGGKIHAEAAMNYIGTLTNTWQVKSSTLARGDSLSHLCLSS